MGRFRISGATGASRAFYMADYSNVGLRRSAEGAAVCRGQRSPMAVGNTRYQGRYPRSTAGRRIELCAMIGPAGVASSEDKNMTKLPIFICCGLLAACSTSPTGRSQFSFLPESQLQQLGDQAFEKIKKETPESK